MPDRQLKTSYQLPAICRLLPLADQKLSHDQRINVRFGEGIESIVWRVDDGLATQVI
jgi:hypothetical protein